MFRGYLIAKTVFLSAICFSLSAQVQVGLGSYTTNPPGDVPGATPHITSDYSQKITTNKWWVNFITQNGHTVAYGHPLSFDAGSGGIGIGYQSIDRWSQNHQSDISVGMDGLSGALAASHSDWAITMRWEGGGNTMEALMGQGFPFVYFKIEGAGVNITGADNVWYNENGVLGVTANGNPYAVFGPSGCSWSTGGTLSSNLGGNDYLSVALLPEESETALGFYKQYAYSHVTETRVSWAYNEDDAQLVSTFSVTTDVKEGSEEGTIFALLRHQWLDAVTPFTDYTYESVRGEMKVVAANEFITSMTFDGILPALPYVGHDLNTLNSHINNQEIERTSGDTYGAGYRMGHYGHVAQIAHLAGNTQRRDEFLDALKESLEEWFTVGDPQQFYYDDTWNRLIGYPASYGSDDRLSDHHFHYGYFIQAAAIIGKWDRDWIKEENWGGMVDLLVRDISAWEEDDPMFGRFQTFDPYEGHGWADGMGFAAGNNQESASESMNCNNGLINWGIQTGNKTIRDMGIFMYVHEARAIENYWWDVDNAVFPDDFDHTCVGMVWSNGGAYGTWFSGDPCHIHGISLLPITGGSMYMGRNPDYIPLNFEEGNTGCWQDIFYEFLAFSDPDRAYNLFSGTGSAPASGSMALCYYNISSLREAGQLNRSVVGDIPSYAVFDNSDNQRTYTAYNPESAPVTVSFSDGFSMEVPARTQITQRDDAIPVKHSVAPNIEKPVYKTRKFNTFGNISFPELSVNIEKIEVYDLRGKKIMTLGAGSSIMSIKKRFENQTKGVYLIKPVER